MNVINFFSKNFTCLNIEQKLLQKLLYFNITKYIQELMILGFEYSFLNPTVLNLESNKNYFFSSPLYRVNEFLKTNYLIKEFTLKKNVRRKKMNSYTYFLKFIKSIKAVNPFLSSLHLMSDTGAKANWNQICQLIGLRGYLINSQGESFKLPILNNFSKGLKFYEYFLSCCGSRKGVLDTAIKTANSGYLTRRLVDSSQEVSIKEYDCNTNNYIKYTTLLDYKGNIIYPLFLFFYGKVLTNNIINCSTKKIIEYKDKYITSRLLKYINSTNTYKYTNINIRSIKLCMLHRYSCSKCFGFSTFKNNYLGKSIGVLSGQSVGEPSTQLILRTFHTGGTVGMKYTKNKIFLNTAYKIKIVKLKRNSFKLCSILKKKNLSFNMYISYVFNIHKLNNIMYFLLKKNKSINLLLVNNKLIYYVNIYNILNIILFTYTIYNIYQRKNNKCFNIIESNFYGEILLNKSIFLISRNIFNTWYIFNLNNSLIYKRFFNMFIISKYNYLTYKISKNNRNLKIYILKYNIISLFSSLSLIKFLNIYYRIFLYTIFFNSNKYNIYEKINKKNYTINKFNIFKISINKLNSIYFI